MSDNIYGRMRPFDFGKAISGPFQSGAGSIVFTLKSVLFYALAMTMIVFLFGQFFVEAFTDIMRLAFEMEEATPTESELEEALLKEMFSVMGKITLPIFAIIILGWCIVAMVEAAYLRRTQRGELGGLFPWKFGKDELRVMFCQLIVVVIGLGAFIVIYFIIIMVVVGAIFGGTQSTALGVVIGVVAFFVIIAAIGAISFLMIRISPASALSIAKQEFAFGEVWPVTKGRFWPIFGAHALMSFIWYIASNIVQVALVLMFMGSFMAFAAEFEDMEGDDPTQILTKIMDLLSDPSFIVGMAIAFFIYYVMQAVFKLLFAGISSHAVKLFLQDQSENSVDVFN